MLEIETINSELCEMRSFFTRVIGIVPSFNITDPGVLPYGLKPHTRSISWIAEQVIVQQAKYNRERLGVLDVDFDQPDTSLHDCEVVTENKQYFANVKITRAGGTRSRNDIAAVEKLFMQYSANVNYRLIYAVFKFSFDNTLIHFAQSGVHVFSPQFLPVYVNPRNDKVQADYYSKPEERTREEFLRLLQENSKSIRLG